MSDTGEAIPDAAVLDGDRGGIREPIAARLLVPLHTPPAGIVAMEGAEEKSDNRTAPDSELRHAESLATIARLTAALAARDRFIAAVGHELRNSVAPLMLLADHFEGFAEDPNATSRLPSRVAILTKNLRKFVGTIDRVTEVADLRKGQIDLEISAVDLAGVVRDVTWRLRHEAAAGGVEVVIDASQPAMGWWDRTRVDQVVSNLLSNAIRYAGPGVVTISIRLLESEVELVVRDRGPGIATESLATLFDHLDRATAVQSGGFGVGLFVAKTLVVAMGGTVSAENPTDGGALFRVLLPRG